MTEELDLRGLKCPEPAIRTGKALRNVTELTVIVDDPEAVQNISRGVKKRGYEIDVEQKGDDHHLNIRKVEGAMDGEAAFDLSSAIGPTVAFFPADTIGRGDDELGKILVKSIIYSFLEVEPKPDTIIFMNSGVKLAVKGSGSLEDLGKLAEQGTVILVCGTCLDYFGLKEDLEVGEVSNAYTIAETLLEAGNVVRF
jgi:selenium metabolism protein YedF